MVTLPEEITYVWCRPKILSAVLFLINRYVALVGNIFGLFIDFLPAISDESCSTYMLVRELSLFLSQIAACLILTLRIYALYGRSRRLLICMVIIGIALTGGASAGSFTDNSKTATDIQGSDCHNTLTAETAARQCILSHCMQVDDTATLPTCRLWASLGCSFCLRITHLCPHNLEDLED